MHPIDPFLEAWGHRAKRNGFDVRRRVYRALELGGRWNRARLKVTLRTLLVTNSDERREFEALFNDSFADDGHLVASSGIAWSPAEALEELRTAAEQVAPSEDVALDVPHDDRDPLALGASGTTPSETPRVSQAPIEAPPAPAIRRRVFVILVLVVSSCVALLIAYGASRGERSFFVKSAPTSDDAGDVQQGNKIVGDEVPGQNAEAGRSEREPSDARWSVGLAALALIVQGAVLLVWRRARARAVKLPEPPPPRELDPLRSRDLVLRSPRLEVFDRRNVRRFAYLLGSEAVRSKTKLDLHRTVQQTLHKGTFFPVFALTRRPNRIAFILGTTLDPVAEAVVDAVVASMRREGIALEVLSLHQRPLDPFDVGLFVANLRELGDRPLPPALDERKVAIIEARDPALWGPEVRDCPHPVFSLDEPGLAAAIRTARRRRTEISPTQISTYRPTHGIAGLREAFPVAAACALVEPCDLGAINELRLRLSSELSFLAIQRILALPGVAPDVTGIRFTPSMREALVGRLGTTAQKKALEWHIRRLEGASAPPMSRAAAMRDRELALAQLRRALLEPDTLDAKDLEKSIVELERQARTPLLSTRLDERASDFRGWFERLPADIREALDRARDLRWRLSRLPLLPVPTPPSPSRAAYAGLIAGTVGAVTLFAASVPSDAHVSDAIDASASPSTLADTHATTPDANGVNAVDDTASDSSLRANARSSEGDDASMARPPSPANHGAADVDAARTNAVLTLKNQTYDHDQTLSAKTIVIAPNAKIRVTKGATLSIRAEQLIVQGRATFDGRGEDKRGEPGGNGARIEIAYSKVQGDARNLQFLVNGGKGSLGGDGGSYTVKPMPEGINP